MDEFTPGNARRREDPVRTVATCGKWRNVYALRRKHRCRVPAAGRTTSVVYDNVALAPRLRGVKKKVRARRRSSSAACGARRCGTRSRTGSTPSDSLLSGGQQQRLTIARALSQEPELLLLDEFSIAVDPVTTMRIEDVLKELKRRDDHHSGHQSGAAGAPARRSHCVLPVGPARCVEMGSDRGAVHGHGAKTGGRATTWRGVLDS